MKYKVTYLDSNGIRKNEELKYQRRSDLLDDFKLKDNKVINIEEIKSNYEDRNLFKKKLNHQTLNNFLKQFGILIHSGIGIKQSLEILYNQEKNKKLKTVIFNIIKDIENGDTLNQSMKNTGQFKDLTIGVVEAGETSASLSKSLNILSKYYENEVKLKQSIKNALYYPIILLLVTFFIVIGIVTFILPNYIKIFDAYENIELPFLTKVLINLNKNMPKNILVILTLIIIINILKKYIKNNANLNEKFSKSALKLPVLGEYLLNLEIQRYSGIFSVLLSSGISLINSLEISANTFNNNYLKNSIYNIKNDVLDGNTLYKSFRKVDVFPDMFLNLINVGEISSSLENTMEISYNYYKDITESQSKKLTAIFEPLIIVLVSIVVGAVVIGIALPTFNLVNIL